MRCLHDRGYSKPSLTALYGRSAGGFTVGTFCNVSPELVQAAILKVCAACGGVLDVCVCVCACGCVLCMRDFCILIALFSLQV